MDPPARSVDDDPVGAWESVRDATQAVLDDPDVAGREVDSPMGRSTVESLIGRFGVADVLVHTWDLATATGQPARLDEELAAEAAGAMASLTDVLVASGHYARPVEVAPHADPTTRLIAITGRDPNWTSNR